MRNQLRVTSDNANRETQQAKREQIKYRQATDSRIIRIKSVFICEIRGYTSPLAHSYVKLSASFLCFLKI